VNSTGHGKTNKTSKDKPLDSEAIDMPSAAGLISKLSNGSQNTEQDDHKKIPANKSPLHEGGGLVEANGNSTQSRSANDVKNNVKENAKDRNVQNNSKKQAPATVNPGHNDAKKPLNKADSNTQNDIKKQAHGANSNVQKVMKQQEQEHATNSSNRSAEVTPHNGRVAHPLNTEHTQEIGKYDDSTGKSIFSDSKSNTAL